MKSATLGLARSIALSTAGLSKFTNGAPDFVLDTRHVSGLPELQQVDQVPAMYPTG